MRSAGWLKLVHTERCAALSGTKVNRTGATFIYLVSSASRRGEERGVFLFFFVPCGTALNRERKRGFVARDGHLTRALRPQAVEKRRGESSLVLYDQL